MAIKFEKAVKQVHSVTGSRVFVTLTNAYSDGAPAGFNQRAIVTLFSKVIGAFYFLKFSDRGRGDEHVSSVCVVPVNQKADPAADYFPGSSFPTVSAALRYLGWM